MSTPDLYFKLQKDSSSFLHFNWCNHKHFSFLSVIVSSQIHFYKLFHYRHFTRVGFFLFIFRCQSQFTMYDFNIFFVQMLSGIFTGNVTFSPRSFSFEYYFIFFLLAITVSLSSSLGFSSLSWSSRNLTFNFFGLHLNYLCSHFDNTKKNFFKLFRSCSLTESSDFFIFKFHQSHNFISVHHFPASQLLRTNLIHFSVSAHPKNYQKL